MQFLKLYSVPLSSDKMMNKEEAIISVENLCLSYGSFKVLEKVSFEVEKGTCMVVMGLSLIHISEPTRPY